MQNSIAKYCHHSSYLMLLSDSPRTCYFEEEQDRLPHGFTIHVRTRTGQVTAWIFNPCQKCKIKGTTMELEIQSYYWLKVQNKCKMLFVSEKVIS